MKTAAIYARVSTTDQKDNGTSLQTQRESGFRRAVELGWEAPPDRVIEEDWTGTDLERRGVRQLLEWARSGEIQGVVIYTLDRLYRPENEGDEWKVFAILEELRKAGIEVAWVDSTIPAYGPGASLMTFVRIMQAGQERRAILERTARGRVGVTREGGLPVGGFTPFGHRFVPRTRIARAGLAIDEKQAETVREVFRLCVAEHLPCYHIAKKLTDLGVPSPTGRLHWNPSTVNGILRNETYTGRYVYRKEGPIEERIIIPVPAIVDIATWEAAQRELAEHGRFSRRNNKHNPYLLRSFLPCPRCGRTCVGAANHGLRSYRCNHTSALNTADGTRCPGWSIKADPIEEMVWAAITETLRRVDLLRDEYQRRQTEAQAPDGVDTRRKLLDLKLRRLRDLRQRQIEAFNNEALTTKELKEQGNRLQREQEAVQAQIAGLEQQEKTTRQEEAAVASLERFCEAVSEGLDNLTFTEKQTLLRLVVARITIEGNKVRIELAIPLDGPNRQVGLRPSQHAASLHFAS